MKPHYALNPPTQPQVSDMEILHAGLGALMAHITTPEDRKNRAMLLSQQLRMIADHPELPEADLRPLYRTLAAYWHFRASEACPC